MHNLTEFGEFLHPRMILSITAVQESGDGRNSHCTDANICSHSAMIEQRNKETAARFQEWKLQQPVTPSPPGSVYVDSDSSNFS
jgi:hypothetical protein